MSSARAPRALLARLAGILLAGALGAAACGGGGPRLGEEAFRTRADAQCAALAEASEELGLAQEEGAAGDEVREYVEGAADGLRDTADGLGALRPPRALEASADDLVEALREYADGLDELASRVEEGQGLTDALESAPKLVARLNGLADRATQRVVVLGLAGCQIAA